jgi:hypothetical protein
MPWQPTVTPAAPLAHASSPSHIRPRAPRHHTSRPAQHLCADTCSGRICERLSIIPSCPPQLGQRRGDGDNGCQRDGVKRHWDDQHNGWPERASWSNESSIVRLPDQRPSDSLSIFSRRCILSVSIDRLDNSRADTPLIPKAYTYLLGVQCLVSLSDRLVGYTLSKTPS